MQHETKMENQSWLKKLARRLGPGHIVNLCFIVVLLFSTLLTWREVVVLEDAYISSQRNHLENVANALDKHLQYNVDKLIFLRNGMREALIAPLDFTSLRDAVTEFEQHRDEHAWQIELNRRRTLPVNGVSDALVSEGNLLSRENESLDNEITAALEVGYLLRLAHNSSSMVETGDVCLACRILRFDAADLVYAQCPDALLRLCHPTLVYRPFTTRKSSPRGTLVHFATGTRQQY